MTVIGHRETSPVIKHTARRAEVNWDASCPIISATFHSSDTNEAPTWQSHNRTETLREESELSPLRNRMRRTPSMVSFLFWKEVSVRSSTKPHERHAPYGMWSFSVVIKLKPEAVLRSHKQLYGSNRSEWAPCWSENNTVLMGRNEKWKQGEISKVTSHKLQSNSVAAFWKQHMQQFSVILQSALFVWSSKIPQE